jgi:hypothetical protein
LSLLLTLLATCVPCVPCPCCQGLCALLAPFGVACSRGLPLICACCFAVAPWSRRVGSSCCPHFCAIVDRLPQARLTRWPSRAKAISTPGVTETCCSWVRTQSRLKLVTRCCVFAVRCCWAVVRFGVCSVVAESRLPRSLQHASLGGHALPGQQPFSCLCVCVPPSKQATATRRTCSRRREW